MQVTPAAKQPTQYSLPEHFRWQLECCACPASIAADGHYSMSCMDAWLSAHLVEFGHVAYRLIIKRPEGKGG